MMKTFTITYLANPQGSYLPGPRKQVTVKGTIAQARRFATVYADKYGFGNIGSIMIREVA